MAATTNTSNSWAQAQPRNPPPMMPFGGFGAMNMAVPQLLGWAINGYAPLMLFLGVLAGARSYTYQILVLLEKYFTTELHVRPSDPPYDMLMSWVYSQGLDKSARSRIVRVDDSGTNTQSHGDDEEKPIWFAPWNGSFLFWFRGTPLSYRSYTTSTAFREEEHIIIKCLGRSGKILDVFIKECRQEYIRQNQNTTAVFEPCGGYWKRTAIDVPRPLSTVIIAEELKKQLVDDLEQYLDADNQAKYSEHRMPYRRGYLLYGPPGTGKSSLTAAIAGHCGLNIYIVDVPSVNDEQLRELFRRLPRKCIVLLEDIDAVGADRDEDGAEHKGQRHRLSKSGLLNALDGVAAQQGRLLIMTTNHREKLDPALIRPGRIDLHLELNYADSKLTANVFEFMYKPVGDAAPLSKAESVAIERAAREFAAIVPECKFSVAEIIAHIREHWESPAMAVKNSGKWVTQALREKEDRRNENITAGTAGSASPTAREAVEVEEPEWLWGIGSFGWSFASTFPESWFTDGMEDCRTEASDESSEDLFTVPPKRLSAAMPRTISYESCPGLVSPSQTSLAQTDSFDSPTLRGRVISSGWHDEEIGRKVQEWSDSMIGSVDELVPVKDNADDVETSPDNNACASINDCAFDEVCDSGFCTPGLVPPSNGPASNGKPTFTLCTDDGCNLKTDLVADSLFPADSSVYVAAGGTVGVGPPSRTGLGGWRIDGPVGVDVFPEHSTPGWPGGYGWQDNSIALRTDNTGGNSISYSLNVQAGKPVTVYFSAESNVRKPLCAAYPPGSDTLHVTAQDQLPETYHISSSLDHFTRQANYVFTPTESSSDFQLTFSTEGTPYKYGCSPLIYAVHATQDQEDV
ncbi:hypothetical protein NLG97_g350 [Lecanicillium saksenae]|uniref:Uncharacterized protein n=1 Tax=Lecanicillium saksenae TaxID=468837 RepID=A0ACC1R6V5_9HYPO|nr:hypothetical protein NLG97_g350 [Lecanicillium saksenae]